MLKWSRFRRFSRGQQSEDRQPDDNCADRPFHNDEGYPADRRALGLNEPARRTSSDTYVSDSACKLSVCAMHVYEIRPRADRRGFELISDALPFGRLWYAGPNAASIAISYAKFFSRSHDAVIHVYDEAGNVIAMHQHAGEFKEF